MGRYSHDDSTAIGEDSGLAQEAILGSGGKTSIPSAYQIPV